MNVMRMGCAVMGLLVLSTACSKKEDPVPAAGTVDTPTPSSPPSSAAAVAVPAAASSAPQDAANKEVNAARSETAPESFSDGTKVPHAVATGLGCETTEKEGWLQLLCRKKNGAGGHPKRAQLGEEGSGQEFLPDEQGELRVKLPYRAGAESTGTVEWTDTKYNLTVKGTELKLEWAVGLEVRRACAKLETESKELITKAQKLESPEHLTPLESSKFPVFGRCQPAGLGSWALGLRAISAAGKDETRALTFELDVVRVDAEGKLTRADFGTLRAPPGGLELKPLQIYDYDDDGRVEVIIPFDFKTAVPGESPKALSAVWTDKSGKVEPYAQLPALLGSAQTTQLEFDMRTDIGGYSPFIAYLGKDCGGTSCPPRLTGPVRYARAVADGSFSLKDPQALAAVTRACPKGLSVATETSPSRLALAVACARLNKEPASKLEGELTSKAATLCKGETTCGLLDALLGFAKASLEESPVP
jgi:hypothetical protein